MFVYRINCREVTFLARFIKAVLLVTLKEMNKMITGYGNLECLNTEF